VSPGEADVTFHCETSTATLVIFGRLPLVDAIADGRVQVEGEMELAAAFGQSFQGGKKTAVSFSTGLPFMRQYEVASGN
jgi:hypothetical protein